MAREGTAGNGIEKPLTVAQMDKYAELVAAGEAEFPDGLSREQEAALARRTRARLRDRLVDLVARRVAHDIALAAATEKGQTK